MGQIVSRSSKEEEGTTITTVPLDILLTHIIPRLDGLSLASLSCASTSLRSLCTDQSLWTHLCHAMWPSTKTPLMRQFISGYPNNNGHRAFFSDAFPFPLVVPPSGTSGTFRYIHRPIPPAKLIFAVDLHYKNECCFSKVIETDTSSDGFNNSTFRIDILDPNAVVSVPIDPRGDLEEDLRLSWIVVDPAARRALNVSSRRVFSVSRDYWHGSIELTYATVFSCDRIYGVTEPVMCRAVVRGLERSDGITVEVVRLKMEDKDGKSLIGRDSLVILQPHMVYGRNWKSERKYLEKEEKKKEREFCSVIMIFAIVVLFFCGLALWLLVWARGRQEEGGIVLSGGWRTTESLLSLFTKSQNNFPRKLKVI